VFWDIYEDYLRFREWLSHRRTRAMRARLEALAERYAERTQAPLILILDEPDRYRVERYQCDKGMAEDRLWRGWTSVAHEAIREQYMN